MDIHVLNRNFETTAVVDRYKSLIWTDRYNDWGDFEIVLDPSMRSVIHYDDYISIDYSDRLMIVETMELESDAESGSSLKISGRSLESILTRRVVWDRLELNTDIQTAISRIVRDNILYPSIKDRKIPNFDYMENPAIPKKYTVSLDLQGQEIFDIVKEVCDLYNVGFKVSWDNESAFLFQLYEGYDRSYSQDVNPPLLFSSKLDNITNENFYESKESYKNVIHTVGTITGLLVENPDNVEDAGDIQPEDRTVVYDFGSASGLDRREQAVVTTVSNDWLYNPEFLIYQEGFDMYNDSRIEAVFEGEIAQVNSYIYGIDYFIGDKVQVEDRYNNNNKSMITEVIISVDEGELSIIPSFVRVEEE